MMIIVTSGERISGFRKTQVFQKPIPACFLRVGVYWFFVGSFSFEQIMLDTVHIK